MHALMMRWFASCAVVVLVTFMSSGVASADASGDAWVDRSDVGASAGDGVLSPGSAGVRAPARGSSCTYSRLDEEVSRIADDLASSGWGNQRGDGPGAWYRKVCPDGSGTVVWIPSRGVDPAVLAQQAFDRATIPLPGINLNPPAGTDQVVNVATWLWVDNFRPVAASASAGRVTVTVTARPVRVEWSMGTGETVTCATGGTAYDPRRPPEGQRTACSHTYRHSSASKPGGMFTVGVTAVWHVTWAATGLSAAGDFGFVKRSADVNVRVAEIQALHE